MTWLARGDADRDSGWTRIERPSVTRPRLRPVWPFEQRDRIHRYLSEHRSVLGVYAKPPPGERVVPLSLRGPTD